MRVSAITGFNTVTKSGEQKKHVSAYYSEKPKSLNNTSPSFGVLIIDNIYNWSIRKINKSYNAHARKQIGEIRRAVLDDVDLLATRKGVSKESVQKEYGQAILKGGLIPKYDGKESGLNKVIGYSLEKLEVLKKVVVPILEASKTKQAGEVLEGTPVPTGIVIHGRDGGGKFFFAKSLLEHIDCKSKLAQAPIKTMTVNSEWWKGDTKENITALRTAFNEARKHNKQNEKTVIFIDNMNEIFTAENNKKLVNEFVKQTQHPEKDGITWMGTIEDTNNLSKPFFRPARTSLFVEIDKPKSESETQALFYHFAANTGRESQFDDRYIMDYTRNSDIPFTPQKIKQIVKFADDELKMAKDYTSKRKGDYIAPLGDMQMMMGVDYVARYNRDVVIPVGQKKASQIPMEIKLNLKNPVFENKKAV